MAAIDDSCDRWNVLVLTCISGLWPPAQGITALGAILVQEGSRGIIGFEARAGVRSGSSG